LQIDLEYSEFAGYLESIPDDLEQPWHLEGGETFIIDPALIDLLEPVTLVGESIHLEGFYQSDGTFYVLWVELDDAQDIHWFQSTLIDRYGPDEEYEEESNIEYWVLEDHLGLFEIQVDSELASQFDDVELGQLFEGEFAILTDDIWDALSLETIDENDLDDVSDIIDDEEWDWIELWGQVVERPESEDGSGLWQIKDNSGQLYDVLVEYTDIFSDVIPSLDEFVYIEGYPIEDGYIWADLVEVDDAGIDSVTQSKIEEFTGVVRSVPSRNQDNQVWIIQTDEQQNIQVVTDADTTFYPSRPTVGEWVHVLGDSQDNGTLLAWEIALDTFETGEVVVHLAAGVISQTVVSRYHLAVESTLLAERDVYIFQVPNPRGNHLQTVVDKMQDDPDIKEAYLNYIVSIPVETVEANPHLIWSWGTTDTSSTYLNREALNQINLGKTHEHYRGAGQIVAVLDTGIDFDHPSWKEGQILPGLDLIDGDDYPADDGQGVAQGHGTHISGIIAQVAPDSQILPIRVLDGQGRGDTFDLAYAIEWAAEEGADVINLSLGTTDFPPVLWDAINYVVHEMDVVVVAAAGNSNNSKRHYPAAFANTLSVTAVDEQSKRASFANYGHWVNLAAPGTGITSTITGPQGSGYGRADGTSMATPFVSAAALLLHEQTPDATQSQIANRLQQSSSNLNTLNAAYQNQLGSMLDICQALEIEDAACTRRNAQVNADINPDINPEEQSDTQTPSQEASATESTEVEYKFFLPLVKG